MSETVSGTLRWKAPVQPAEFHGSGGAWEFDGSRVLLVATAHGLARINPRTGRTIWVEPAIHFPLVGDIGLGADGCLYVINWN